MNRPSAKPTDLSEVSIRPAAVRPMIPWSHYEPSIVAYEAAEEGPAEPAVEWRNELRDNDRDSVHSTSTDQTRILHSQFRVKGKKSMKRANVKVIERNVQ